MKTLTKEMQNAITPLMALELLKDGNKKNIVNIQLGLILLGFREFRGKCMGFSRGDLK